MRNVIAFLLRYNSWILLAVYIVVSCILLFNFNNFQQSVYLTSANSISASLNGIYNNVESYVELRDANAALEAHNAALQAQVKDLQSQLMATREMLPDSTSVIPQPERFSYMTASVIGWPTRFSASAFSFCRTMAEISSGVYSLPSISTTERPSLPFTTL